MSSAWVQKKGRKCSRSPLQRNWVYFSSSLAQAWFLLSSPLILLTYLFILHWWEDVLFSPLPCAGDPQSLGVFGPLGPDSDS